MTEPQAPPSCPRCSLSFTKVSSLTRHLKRCVHGRKPPPRQKVCKQCSGAKLRCDQQRPACGRCRSRDLDCQFLSRDGEALPPVTTQRRAVPRTALRIQPENENRLLSATGIAAPSCVAAISLTAPQCDSLWTGHSRDVASSEITASDPSGDTSPGMLELTSTNDTQYEILPEMQISEARRRVLLWGMGSQSTSNTDNPATRHTMHFVIRVLMSWPRILASYSADHLPPMVHRLQLGTAGNEELPGPLSNCHTLTKMWTDHTRGSRQLVRNTIIQEIRRLLHEHRVYSELDLLAATQSLLMLLSIVLFGLGRPESGDSSTSPPHLVDEPQLLVAVWDVKHKLAMTGLFLGQEAHHGPSHPSWCDWAFVSAKRRTIQGLHHLEWAWSVFFGYPVLTCFELGPLPAPAAKFLWQATNESKWKRLYGEWLWRWREGGGFKMAEFFTINPGGELDMRSEMWLAEADEFGMMLMAEGK
ncbi:hypothetical protein BKA67DRAFT_576655 [Truncatella angustata]|uniref:Zn(2)-C6 fungal-type domain-containing protein n=1 Tax=Truncatella angustata TaxID=152316 RepID=A0A9P8UFV2_9PEZI|nr:uncharacterized protein BKA67DRAFT_576655 [Truncatella angustata]KAH6649053.1 hypothetical protein BKA67DRAFT_576655 [Truncatella angustata]